MYVKYASMIEWFLKSRWSNSYNGSKLDTLGFDADANADDVVKRWWNVKGKFMIFLWKA